MLSRRGVLSGEHSSIALETFVCYWENFDFTLSAMLRYVYIKQTRVRITLPLFSHFDSILHHLIYQEL